MTEKAAHESTVSLVINTCEQAHFLDDAISSALRQRRRFDEIIVVDDGSTDDPAAAVARHAGVRIVRQPNLGLAASRNTGLREAACRFVVFLDADDMLTPEAVVAGIEAHRRAPRAGMIYGGHRRIDIDGRPVGPEKYDPIGPDPYRTLLTHNPIGMHATVMYDRAALSAVSGFDATLPRCEDYDAYLRIARLHPVASHPGMTALYRWHGANMSADPRTMLHWVLQVNDRQKQHTAGNPELEAARRRGRRVWSDHYAGEVARSVRDRWRRDGLCVATARCAAQAMAFAPPYGAVKLWRAALDRLRPRQRPGLHRVDLGDLATTSPISLDFGFDRGTPIDRAYIDDFLDQRRYAIRGRALEVADPAYCRLFGGDRISEQDVLHVDASNPLATIVGDLADPSVLPSDAFDCIVLTQTLHLIYDVRTAAQQLHRALKPGGTLLLTVPGITPLERGAWGAIWCWSFTRVSAARLFGDLFGPDNVEVEVRGNVFAATAFLQGLALEEVDRRLLEPYDPAYPVIVAVAARKAAA